MFVTAALAQSNPTTPSAPVSMFDPSGPFGTLYMIVPLILIFWLLIFRPQQKRMKAQQAMLSAITRGDTVVTTGGIVGKVTKAVDGEDLEVEIAQGTRVKIVRGMISDVRSRANPASDAKTAPAK